MGAEGSSIILSLHPWVAKGKEYLSLHRLEKELILWNKIIADRTTNPNPAGELDFFDIDLVGVFDEFGDEFDCRHKTVHPQGNVARAEWRNLGGDDYTGVFQGADTAFVRLSTQRPVITPEERDYDDQNVMMATMSVKLLRDGVDSANSSANQNLGGQTSYDFFAAPLFTNLMDSGFENDVLAGPSLRRSGHRLTLLPRLATLTWLFTPKKVSKSPNPTSPTASGTSQTPIYPTLTQSTLWTSSRG